jgi:DNA-binding CsgD family transcriptional regulator
MGRGRPRYDDILTPREREVLALLRERLTNDQIAERLAISPHTAKYHVSEILTKLGLASREQAAAWQEPALPPRLGARRGFAWPLGALGLRIAAGAGLVAVAAVAAIVAFALLRGGGGEENALGRVAYIADGDLWVKDLPDGAPRQLTADGGIMSPQWSPSGDWILFQRTPTAASPPTSTDFGPWVIRADGTGVRKLDGQAAWSPVEDTLALIAPGDPLDLSNSVLVTERADGSQRRVLLPRLSGGGALDRRMLPAWSPDGAWIAFEEQRGGGSPGFSYVGARAVRVDGTEEHELAAATLGPDGAAADGSAMTLLWNTITGGGAAVMSQLIQALGGTPTPAVVGGLPTGLLIRYSTTAASAGIPRLPYRDWLTLSPDARMLAFVAGVDAIPQPRALGGSYPPIDGQDQKALTLFDLATGTTRTLTAPDTVAVSPAWSPDGRTIAYVARPDTGPVPADDPSGGAVAEQPRRLWTVGADGAGAHAIATAGADCRQEHPLWSGDGSRLLFACLAGDGASASLWLVSATGGVAERVIAGVSPDALAGVLLKGYSGHIDWSLLYDYWTP